MKDYIVENLENINSKIKNMESRTYSINDISSLENDRREYDRLIGEKRTFELMLHLIKNEK